MKFREAAAGWLFVGALVAGLVAVATFVAIDDAIRWLREQGR